MHRGLLYLALVLIGFSLAAPVAANGSTSPQVLARNILISNQVLELESDLDGRYFRVVWTDTQGNKGAVTFVSRAGRHAYDPRIESGWVGELAVVAVQGIPAAAQPTIRLKHPTLADEIDLFLAPEIIRPNTVNLLRGTTLFGWRWNHVLLLVFPLLLWPLWRYGSQRTPEPSRTRLPASLLLWAGFVSLWCVMDLRSTYDRAYVMWNSETNQHIDFITKLYARYDHLGRQLGDLNWTDDDSEVVTTFPKLVLRYVLAEHQFVLGTSAEDADVAITSQSYRPLGAAHRRDPPASGMHVRPHPGPERNAAP